MRVSEILRQAVYKHAAGEGQKAQAHQKHYEWAQALATGASGPPAKPYAKAAQAAADAHKEAAKAYRDLETRLDGGDPSNPRTKALAQKAPQLSAKAKKASEAFLKAVPAHMKSKLEQQHRKLPKV